MSVKGTITTADYFQYDEFKRLIDCLVSDEQHIWAFYCMISFCLGLRSSDVRKLKWQDVLNKRSVIVTEKRLAKQRGYQLAKTLRNTYPKCTRCLGVLTLTLTSSTWRNQKKILP